MKKLTTLSILLISFAFVVPAQVSAATSAGVTPGSFFYFFDTTFENISLYFTFDSENKARKALGYADERLAEIEAVAEEKNPDGVKAAIANYESNIALATEKSKEVKDKGQAESLFTSISDNAAKNQEVLAAVLIKVPEEAREAITRAIEVSRKGQEEATRQITELKKEVSELKQELENLKGELKDKEEDPKASGDKKDEQTNAIDKLKNEIESLKKKVSEPSQKETKTESKKEESENSIVNLPSGAVVELDTNGNIVRTIKEAPQQTYTTPAPTAQSQNQTQTPPIVSPVQTPQPVQTPAPSCTQDTWSCSDWLGCSSSGSQIRTCNKTFDCSLVNTSSPATSQSCTPPTPSCQADMWSCGDWNSCSSSGNQIRSCTKTFDCSSVATPSPTTSQSCTPPTITQIPAPTPTPPPVVTEISYSDYNFNYQWTPWAGGSTLSCPMTPRNIVIKKAVFEIPDSELQKITTLRALETDGFKIILQTLSTFHSRRANLSLSGTYSLEEKSPNTFVYFGGNIPICGDGAVVSINDIQDSFMDIVDGRNVKVYLAQKGITMDVESISNGVSFYLLVSPVMAEWEVWDYTTNKPVKIN